MAAPGWAWPSSSASPRRWAAIWRWLAEPGGGSRFRFAVTVDAVAQAPAAAQAEGAAAPSAPVRPLDILCVEDNPYGRVLLNTILSELGHRPDFVGTGAGAVDAVAHRHYDVVLMDVTLPDIDGVEATRRIRALEGSAGRVPSSASPAAPSPPTKRPAGRRGWTAISPSRSARARSLRFSDRSRNGRKSLVRRFHETTLIGHSGRRDAANPKCSKH